MGLRPEGSIRPSTPLVLYYFSIVIFNIQVVGSVGRDRITKRNDCSSNRIGDEFLAILLYRYIS